MDDKLGGIASLNCNLIRYHGEGALPQQALLLHCKEEVSTRFDRSTGADTQATFEYSSFENMYAVLRRLRDAIPDGPGALVSNGIMELQMLEVHGVDRAVVQIVHDEWNLELSRRHEPVVDAFVAHSKYFYEQLRETFPSRREHIFYLPYGIPLAPRVRQPVSGSLRLLFIGRMVESKGIFDLPIIDRLLSEAGVQARWVVVGDGPQKQELRDQWGDAPHVRYEVPPTNEEVLELCVQSDVLVFPTRFEGFPVSLLEAMSAGVVPVVSDLPSGVPEVVSAETGFRPAMKDCRAFADGVIELDRDRDRLEAMSRACRRVVEEKFDIRERARDYQSLFARYEELRRPSRPRRPPPVWSRLDHPWVPNPVVLAVRKGLALLASSTPKKQP